MQLYLKQTLWTKNILFPVIHSSGVDHAAKSWMSKFEPFPIFPQAEKSGNADVIKWIESLVARSF